MFSYVRRLRKTISVACRTTRDWQRSCRGPELTSKIYTSQFSLLICYIEKVQKKTMLSLHFVYKNRIYLGLVRLPVLIDCMLSHEGPHSSVVSTTLINPLRTANEKLSKLKEMIETTIDLKQAEQGEFIVNPTFDDQLGGIWLINENISRS